jgi:hypothetical protein
MCTARGLLLVMMEIDPDYEAEFNRWFDEEHLPERLSCPGFESGRRYRAVEGESRYLALYELESPAVLESAAYRAMAPPSAWTQRVQPAWLRVVREVYEDITPAIPPGYVPQVERDAGGEA